MRADDPYGGPSGSGALGWALRQLAIWGGLTLLLYTVVGNRTWFEPAQHAQPVQSAAVQAPQPAPVSQTSQVPTNTMAYRADQRGHVTLEAMVIENLGVSLLGQSFLKRLDAYEMRDGVLTITWN